MLPTVVTALVLAAFSLATAPEAYAQTALSFDKSFAPSTIGPGSVSTLQFTLTNNLSTPVSNVAFTDNLPASVVIATPANLQTTCNLGSNDGRGTPGSLTVPDGGTSIVLTGGRLGATDSCIITLDVTSSTVGVHANDAGVLTSSGGSSDNATADLTVDAGRPGFSKSFSPNPVSLGSTSTLTFNINNSANTSAASGLLFSDNLPAGMVIATPANATTDCTGGTLTATAGTNSISYTQGFVAASSNCSVSVDVTTNNTGDFFNNTSEFESTGNGSSGRATAVLSVEVAFLAKTFVDDPVVPGGTVTLEFTITNPDRDNSATNIAFDDDLDAVLSGLAATGLPQNVCGGTVSGTSTISFSGGSLGAGDSCTFNVSVDVPGTAATGTYTNTTTSITALIDGQSVTGDPATDDLVVDTAPVLTKSFSASSVAAGGSVTLTFVIDNTSSSSSISDIAFTDNLTQFIPELGTTLPANGFCGTGSSIVVGGFGFDDVGLVMTGGNLPASGSCTFDVTLDVPEGTTSGSYTNTTSPITATLGSATVEGDEASADLVVVGAPTLTKVFNDSPVTPGGTVTLQFTLFPVGVDPVDPDFEDVDVLQPASDIAFTDNLDAVLSGLAPNETLPKAVCGGMLDFTSGSLSFSNGSIAADESCLFTVSLSVPSTAVTGTYTNTTSTVTATVLGLTVEGAPATADLVVTTLDFTKSFSPNPVEAGGAVSLTFTITNNDPTNTATIGQFTDDLDAVISGLAASGSPTVNTCGGTLSGTTSLTYSGGSVAANSSCTITVPLTVPEGTTPDTYFNITSDLSVDIGAGFIGINPATAPLTVESEASLMISKAFIDDPVEVGQDVTLEFTITHEGGSATATDISFMDDLDAVLTGLAVTGSLPSTPCGSGSTLTNTNEVLELTGGTLAPTESCTFSVTLTVPATSIPGNYTNTTTTLTATVGNETVAYNTATDALTVEEGEPTQGRNEPPVVTTTSGTTAFVEDVTGAVGIDAGVTVTDVDDTDLEGATVSITAGFESSQDVLGFTDQNGITGSYNSGTGVLTLTGTSSVANYQTALQSVTYDNTSQDPSKTEPVPLAAGPRTVAFQADDGSALSNTATKVVSVTATNDGPTADAGEDQTVECTSSDGADVTLDGSGSSDPENNTLSFSWAEGGQEIATGESPTVTLALGTHTITLTVDDGAGGTDTDDVVITVEDTTPPVITLNGDNPLTIIRFSGPYVEPGATVTDACDPNPTLTIAGSVDTNLPGAYQITYDASDASGNDAAQVARTVNVIDDPDALAHDFLLLADKKIEVDESADDVEGDLHSNDKITLKKGPATYTSDLTAVGEIKIEDDVTVEGDVTSGNDVDLGSNVTVTGTVSENASVSNVPLPTLSFSAGGNDIEVEENETLALAPGSYGEVEVEDGATLQLSTGVYFFEELTVEEAAFLEIDVSTGPVEVNVEKKIDINEEVTMSLSPLGEEDSRHVTFNTKEDLSVDKKAVLLGQWIAEGKADLAEEVMLRGSICAEEIIIDKDAVLLQHDASEALPEPAPEAAPETGTPTAQETGTEEIPSGYVLEANYPNPFNPETRIRFSVPESAHVTLTVYDVLGRQVRVLVEGVRAAGTYEAVFEAGDLPSGTYLYRLVTPEGSFVKTMLLLK